MVGGKSGRGQREFGEALNNGIHAQTQICGGASTGVSLAPHFLSSASPDPCPQSTQAHSQPEACVVPLCSPNEKSFWVRREVWCREGLQQL